MAEIRVQCKDGDYSVLVDDDDYEWLSAKPWWDLNGYAVTYGGPSIIGMHRLIMGVTERNMKVEHKHGNRRDCRREELRVILPKKKHVPLAPTEEPGIFWSEAKKLYIVILYHPETENRYFFGDYKTLPKAVKVRNAERDKGGFKTTRAPRSWEIPGTPQDDPPAPATP
jgi:hypothetical protein